jgi:hypothetical protein
MQSRRLLSRNRTGTKALKVIGASSPYLTNLVLLSLIVARCGQIFKIFNCLVLLYSFGNV